MANVDTLAETFPHLCFSQRWRLEPEVYHALGQCDAIVESISQVPLLPKFSAKLHHVALKKGAQATTAIEGNTLSDEEVDRVARGEKLLPSQEYQEREVANVISAFNTLLAELVFADKVELISPELLLRFHKMIGKDLGEHFAAVPGTFAQSQRIVGPYRPPPPQAVPGLVARLCEWLREQFHYPDQRLADAIIQAIVTHVYIEWIHPFDDGNGRTGRLVEFYILVRGGLPSLASHLLSNHYNETRTEYYRQLQRAKQERDLSGFLSYAIIGLRDGLQKSVREVQQGAREQMWRVLVYEAFGKRVIKHREVFTRQREVALTLPLDRDVLLSEVPALSESLAKRYARTTPRTILRDLAELQKLDLIVRTPGMIRANTHLLDATAASDRRQSPRPSPSLGLTA
jgi:Fic family protein